MSIPMTVTETFEPQAVEFQVNFGPDHALAPQQFGAVVLDYGPSRITSVVFRLKDTNRNRSGHLLAEGLNAYAYDVDPDSKPTIREALEIAIGYLERDFRE